MVYSIRGVLTEDKKLSLAPVIAAEGEGVHTLDVTFPAGLTLENIRVEYEHPTGLARRNRYSTDYLTVGENGRLIAPVPAAALAHAGKVYVQITGQSDGKRWRSLFSHFASFIVSPAIEADQITEPDVGNLTDRIESALGDVLNKGENLEADFLEARAQLIAAQQTAVDGVKADAAAAIDGIRASFNDFSARCQSALAAVQTQVETFVGSLDAAPVAGSENAVKSGGVASAIAALDAAKQPAGVYFSPENLPSRGTAEDGAFNPFFGVEGGEVWLNRLSGGAHRNTVVLGDGKGNPGDLKARLITADFMMSGSNSCALVATESDCLEDKFPVGAILDAVTPAGAWRPGDTVDVVRLDSDPTVISADPAADGIYLTGTWIALQELRYGSSYYVRVQRDG